MTEFVSLVTAGWLLGMLSHASNDDGGCWWEPSVSNVFSPAHMQSMQKFEAEECEASFCAGPCGVART